MDAQNNNDWLTESGSGEGVEEFDDKYMQAAALEDHLPI